MIKLVDQLSPMGSFPVAEAKDINFSDNESLQDKYDNGELGGGGTADVPIEKIKVNGELQTPVNKVVDISVPTVTNDLTDELKAEYDEAVTAKHTHDNADVLDGITAEKIAAWNKAEENVQADWNETDDTADGFIKNKPTIPSKISELDNDSNYQTADDITTTLAPYAKSEDVTNEITTEVAKIVADAPEDFNTLKEMSDWIASHENDASAMNSAILKNKTDIETLQTGKADASDLTAHKDDTDIHVSTEDRTKWDSAKTHADSAHAPSNAQENVLETVKVNGTALTPSSKAVNIDLSDYAKTIDIPTTLPANGGNADTVNNHTVETDVPTDAKFTDTIYDDTEVKGSIEEVNSNLDTLTYGENAGGKNLIFTDELVGKKLSITQDIGGIAPNGDTITFSISTTTNDDMDNSKSVLYIMRTDGTNSTPVNNGQTLTLTDDDKNNFLGYRVNVISSLEGKIVKSIQVEVGTTVTEYKPYIPSVKMLAEENEQQSSNLNTLEFGKVAGVRNLFEDEIKWMENIPITRGTKSVSDGKITLTATSADCYTDHDVSSWKNNGIKTIPCKPNTKYTFSWEYEGDSVGDIYIFENGSINNMSYTINKEPKLTITTSADAEYLIVRVGVRDSGTSITYWNFQLEEGDTATSYEPYIPSVKMLAEENEQQNTEAMDTKMLGWNVPSECPVQNYVDSDGVFHQRVGRVDLGNLDWIYSSEYKRFSTSGITDYKKKDSGSNTWVADAFLKGYSTTSGNDTASDSYNKSIGFNGQNDMFFVKNTSYTDATSFKNAMQGQYLYYELATEISMNVDGNEAVTKVNDSLSVIGKCKNLLKPVFVSGWGCNCVIGDDGKITLTSTNTEDYQVVIGYIHKCSLKANKTYYFRAFDIINIDHIGIGKVGSGDLLKSFYNQLIYTPTEDMDIQLLIYFSDKTVGTISSCYISVSEVYTDEYVPYTGDGDTLTHDVANLRGSLNELITYSTEEQIAGTYLDGKTIYRRSLEIPLDGELQKTHEFINQGVTALEGGEAISIFINQITPSVDLSAWNIDNIVKVYGHVTQFDSTKTNKLVDIQYPVTYNSAAYVTGWYSYTNKNYVIRVGEQYANHSTAFLTFEYTKV